MLFRSLMAFALLSSAAGAESLSDAVKTGDAAAVRSLLERHVDVNAPDPDGTTPLDWAVENVDFETAQLLLKAGARAEVSNRDGVTPLWLAAMHRDARIARLLLQAGADANHRSPSGENVLMAAARTGDPELVDLLLSSGADPNGRGSAYGETALMLAAAANQADAIRALVAHGAEVDARSSELRYSKDRFGLEGVLTILPQGSWTALMYAAREGSPQAARALEGSGANLNLTDPDGTTALCFAILNGHYDTAALLVESGADPNLADHAGMAALYAAVDMNTLGEVYGRPPRTSQDKSTALDLMKVLLAHGANPNARLTGPALQRAHTPGEPTLGAGATPLMRAAKNGDASAIELLIQHGADVSLAENNGTTALMFAAGLGRGVGTFAKDYATDAQMLEGAKVLVAHGADVNAVSDAGQTAMHFAAQAADVNLPQPSDDMVRFLAAHGAWLYLADTRGRTPIEMAQGIGLRSRAGGPVAPRESTIRLLHELQTQ
ncbi:MAG TPA: ankyrin repeat domain-containing protein [Bryobacteraceae bacterium]